MQIAPKSCKTAQFICRAVFAAFFVLLFSTGCGRKTAPVPPRASTLPAIVEVRTDVQNRDIRLSWGVSPTDRHLHGNIAGFIVYRADVSLLLADCRDCPRNYRQVARIPFQENGIRPERWIFDDRPSRGMGYFYQIRGLSKSGETGPASATVRVVLKDGP